MPDLKPPILGSYVGGYNCGMLIPGGRCDKPATHHIIWDGNRCMASLACAEHISIARQRIHHEIHELVPEVCANILALWFPAEHTCRIPAMDGYASGGRWLT